MKPPDQLNRRTPAYCKRAARKGVVLQYDGITAEPLQWGGIYYLNQITRWAKITRIGFEAYGPSSGAVPPNAKFKFPGTLEDLVNAAQKQKANYLLVWYEDAVKAAPGSKTHDRKWEAAMKLAQRGVKPGPSSGAGRSR